MFTVYEKGVWENDERIYASRPKSVVVYAVRDDKNGYPHFLICENGEWKYRSAKYYTNEPKIYRWHDREDYPEVHKDIIVRDFNGREHENHYWTGCAYYKSIVNEDFIDGCPSDIDIVAWRYK